MGAFDDSKAYAAQEEVYFNDGREIALLHFVYERDDIDELRGSPEKVLAAIDDYGRTTKYLMNVGENKGKIVTDLIAEHKPNFMVSLIPSMLGVFLTERQNRLSLEAMSATHRSCSELRSSVTAAGNTSFSRRARSSLPWCRRSWTSPA